MHWPDTGAGSGRRRRNRVLEVTTKGSATHVQLVGVEVSVGLGHFAGRPGNDEQSPTVQLGFHPDAVERPDAGFEVESVEQLGGGEAPESAGQHHHPSISGDNQSTGVQAGEHQHQNDGAQDGVELDGHGEPEGHGCGNGQADPSVDAFERSDDVADHFAFFQEGARLFDESSSIVSQSVCSHGASFAVTIAQLQGLGCVKLVPLAYAGSVLCAIASEILVVVT
jgi:hypothetical protein